MEALLTWAVIAQQMAKSAIEVSISGFAYAPCHNSYSVFWRNKSWENFFWKKVVLLYSPLLSLRSEDNHLKGMLGTAHLNSAQQNDNNTVTGFSISK